MRTISEFINEALIIESGNRDVEEMVNSWQDFAVLTSNINKFANSAAIKSIAKQYKLEVVDRYCDKMQAGDIAGIPVPGKGKGDVSIPGWAKTILDNQNKKYLVLFIGASESEDEDQLYNAMMPMILKHEINGKKCDNFIVGVVDKKLNLPKPLESRLNPVIKV